MTPKAYLGDGVYVRAEGGNLILTAENGVEATDTIVLEPDVYQALVLYAERLAREREQDADAGG